jgi:hypothetical protein
MTAAIDTGRATFYLGPIICLRCGSQGHRATVTAPVSSGDRAAISSSLLRIWKPSDESERSGEMLVSVYLCVKCGFVWHEVDEDQRSILDEQDESNG